MAATTVPLAEELEEKLVQRWLVRVRERFESAPDETCVAFKAPSDFSAMDLPWMEQTLLPRLATEGFETTIKPPSQMAPGTVLIVAFKGKPVLD